MTRAQSVSPRRLARPVVALLLAGTSAASMAEDYRLNFPPLMTMSPKSVNIQTGRFELSRDEFSIGPLAADLKMSVELNNDTWSFPTTDTAQKNIRSTHPANAIAKSLRGALIFDTVPTLFGGTMSVIWVDIGDSRLMFTVAQSGNISVWNVAAKGWSLAQSGSDYIATFRNGDRYTFSDHPAIPTQNGKRNKVLVSKVSADGHRLDYSYGANAELRLIRSNYGYGLLLDYNAGAQTITACGYNLAQTFVNESSSCAAAGIKKVYGFSSPAGYRLTSVTDSSNGVTGLQYTADYGLLRCITLVNSSTCEIENFFGPQPGELIGLTHLDQVRRQVTATGATWLYRYQFGAVDDDRPPLEPGEIRYTYSYMTDPTGLKTAIKYANGVLETATVGEVGNQLVTTYEFNGLTPKAVIMPEGNKREFGSDRAGNVITEVRVAKPGSTLPYEAVLLNYPPANDYGWGGVCTAASPVLCDKPSARVDERGNQTDYEFSPVHGHLLKETLPAVNGVRPQTRFTYVQRYAWIKNASGAYAQASAPIWLLASKSICKSGAAGASGGCANPADEVVTTYDYGPDSGPNNLQLRGVVEDATGAALRTCYGYDAQGNRISETRPRAGLASCS